MIERRPEARQIEGVVVADGQGRPQADMAGNGAHIGQQGDRVMFGRLHGVPQGRVERPFVGIGDVVEIGEEDHVELAALTGSGDVLV